jgi:hypothetical protein
MGPDGSRQGPLQDRKRVMDRVGKLGETETINAPSVSTIVSPGARCGSLSGGAYAQRSSGVGEAAASLFLSLPVH